MMNVLLDTNIVLDLVLEREPWITDERELWEAMGTTRLIGHISATTVTDVFYIVRRTAGLPATHQAVRVCLDAFQIVAIDRDILDHAAALPGNDFEDNVQIACAVAARLEAIVTRDPTGFRSAPLPILTPVDVMARLG